MIINQKESTPGCLVMDCTKAELVGMFGPVFGHVVVDPFSGGAMIYMRADLPKTVYQSVLAHERVHVHQKVPTSFWNDEPPAWWAGLKASPIGFVLGILMSLSPERVWFYTQRLFFNR